MIVGVTGAGGITQLGIRGFTREVDRVGQQFGSFGGVKDNAGGLCGCGE